MFRAPLRGWRLFCVLCFVVATVTVTAQADTSPATITNGSHGFRINGVPFIPLLAQVRKCPDTLDIHDSSLTVADDMDAIGVNVLHGPAVRCGDTPEIQIQRLHAALNGRMKWKED